MGHEAYVRGDKRPSLLAQRGVQADMPVVGRTAGSLAGDDGLGSVLLGDALALFGEDRERLIPGDALELAFTAVLGVALSVGVPVYALHRIEQTSLGIVVDLAFRHAHAAANAVRFGILGIAFDAEDLVALRVHEHAAAGVTGRALRPRFLNGHDISFLFIPHGVAGELPAR